jgi:serine/threonine-protein kinase
MVHSADRNLLFGILALQMDFITRDALIAAMNAWVLKKDKPLGDLLEEQGALATADRALLEPLVRRHIDQHGGDPSRSLASLSSVDWIGGALEPVGKADTDVQQTLDKLSHRQSEPTDAAVITTSYHRTADPSSRRFQIVRFHARGGLGEVFVAQDAEVHREVALKQIQDRHSGDPESRSRFLLEAEITGGLEHPGVVPVYGLGHNDDGRPFYAMRFIRGDSLKEAIARFHQGELSGRRPGERILELQKLLRRFLDVCNAIAYAHSRGVLHRDIKPGNIMVGQYGETLVVDWGLAKVVGTRERSGEATLRPPSASGSSETLPGSAIGTPAYMSPEQAAGRLDQLGPASDVYSLGATLYCLLTGKAPIESSSLDLEAILERVQRGDFPRPRQVNAELPRALEAISVKAMALHPGDRYASPRALADDIERWLADEPVAAWLEPISIRTRRWMRRNRTMVAAVAAMVLVGLVALSIAYSRESAINARLAAANRQLQATNAELVEAKDRATKAKSISDQRLETTLQAIEDYYSGVSQEVLLNQKEFLRLRTRLLEKPRQFYERLAAELASVSPQDARGWALLARGRSNLGRILQLIGHHDAARKQYEAAVRLYHDLERARPNDPENLQALAACYKGLAIVLAFTGRDPEASQAIREAIELNSRLIQAQPERPLLLGELAGSYTVLAHVLHKAGSSAQAVEWVRKAIVIQAELASTYPNVRRYSDQLAHAYQLLGNLLRDIGDLKEAEASLRKAIGTETRLVSNDSVDEEPQRTLATSYSDLGIVLQDRGNSRDAADSQRKAIEFAAKLALAHPNVPDYARHLAMGYFHLGRTLIYAQENKEAADAYRSGVPIWNKLVSDHPDVPEYKRGLADQYNGLGIALQQTRDWRGAREWLHKAIEIQAGLVAAYPDVPDHQDRLASSWGNLGVLSGHTLDFGGAIDSFRKAIEFQSKLVASHSEIPEFRTRLGTSFHLLATSFHAQGRMNEANDAFRQAIQHQRIALERSPEGALIRGRLKASYQGLAVTSRMLGRVEEAVEALRQRRAFGQQSPIDHYNDACQLALCVPLVRDETRKQALATEAVNTLRAAVAAGWNDAAHTSRDSDLQVLRDRVDFRRLLAELWDRPFPVDPFAK